MADCAHFGLAPLDVVFRIIWRTTSNPFHGDFRVLATWRSDSALSSESSKNARQWHFIRAEGPFVMGCPEQVQHTLMDGHVFTEAWF